LQTARTRIPAELRASSNLSVIALAMRSHPGAPVSTAVEDDEIRASCADVISESIVSLVGSDAAGAAVAVIGCEDATRSESWQTMDTTSSSTLVDIIESCGGYPELLQWITHDDDITTRVVSSTRTTHGSGNRNSLKLVTKSSPSQNKFQTLKDVSAKVVAKQATLRIHALMAMLQPREICVVATLLKSKDIVGFLRDLPNFERLRRTKYLLQDQIHSMILGETDTASRVRALTWAISLGHSFLEISNFDGTMLVFEALSENCIDRLKKTWEKLSSRTMKYWDKIYNLCSWGGKPLKKLHAKVRLPAVPYLGTFLNELTKVGNLPTW
jgi:hypothetical protein